MQQNPIKILPFVLFFSNFYSPCLLPTRIREISLVYAREMKSRVVETSTVYEDKSVTVTFGCKNYGIDAVKTSAKRGGKIARTVTKPKSCVFFIYLLIKNQWREVLVARQALACISIESPFCIRYTKAPSTVTKQRTCSCDSGDCNQSNVAAALFAALTHNVTRMPTPTFQTILRSGAILRLSCKKM